MWGWNVQGWRVMMSIPRWYPVSVSLLIGVTQEPDLDTVDQYTQAWMLNKARSPDCFEVNALESLTSWCGEGGLHILCIGHIRVWDVQIGIRIKVKVKIKSESWVRGSRVESVLLHSAGSLAD
eukprot:scaffold20738_cov67-Attheya_sp.AAC.3